MLTHNRDLHEVNLGWHPKAEDALWRPELQQAKRSQSGMWNVRYRNDVKRAGVQAVHGPDRGARAVAAGAVRVLTPRTAPRRWAGAVCASIASQSLASPTRAGSSVGRSPCDSRPIVAGSRGLGRAQPKRVGVRAEAVAGVQGARRPARPRGQLEVEDVDVLPHPLGAHRLGEDDVAQLDVPAQHDLGGRPAVLRRASVGQRRVVQQAAALPDRAPRLGRDAVLARGSRAARPG